MASVGVGEEPSGVAVGGGFVWVTNAGSDSVVKIDPVTNELVDSFPIPGGPDDVAVADDFVWVTTAGGDLWRIEPDTGVFDRGPPIRSDGGHLDIAVDDGELFVQVEAGPLLSIDETRNVAQPLATTGEATDVAVGGELVWVYERSVGTVTRFDRTTDEELGSTVVGRTDSQDLAAAGDYAWFFGGEDATLTQISADDGSVVNKVVLDGDFGAISATPDDVWVMTSSGGDRATGGGRLYRISAESAEQLGAPVELDGLPYDVAAGPDGVWITNNQAGTVTHVNLVPVDQEETAPVDPPGLGGRVLFYYAASGDIFAYRADGTSRPVVATDAYESNPAISASGKTLVYQKDVGGSGSDHIMLLAIDDDIYPAGTHERLLDGEWPALSPTGELAWVEPGDSTTATRIGIGPIASEPRAEFDLKSQTPGPIAAGRLAWSASEETLMYGSESEDGTSFSIDVSDSAESSEPEQLVAGEPGEVFVSPTEHPQAGTTVVRLCCVGDAAGEFTIAELGVVTPDGFEKLVGLDDLGLEAGSAMFAAAAGTLEYEATSGWSSGSSPTWLVGDGERLFLVSTAREGDSVPLDGVTGVAVVPGAPADD